MLNRLKIKHLHSLECVALIVDINGSEKIISAGEEQLMAQFFRDLLHGSIRAVEDAGGSVISFTGDGFVSVFPSEETAGIACFGIARDMRRTREYLASDGPETWPALKHGIGLKIGIERGHLSVSTISCEFLSEQPYLVGPPSVYATRIMGFGEGDRCVVGPEAAANWPYSGLSGPFRGKIKHQSISYTYYLFDLGDIWTD
jgi:class 3 adenylate cyclase